MLNIFLNNGNQSGIHSNIVPSNNRLLKTKHRNTGQEGPQQRLQQQQQQQRLQQQQQRLQLQQQQRSCEWSAFKREVWKRLQL